MPSISHNGPFHLIFDADDTLWENNLLFERVIDKFIADLAHPTLTAAQVRAVLDVIEARNAAEYGYGSVVFAANLEECYASLTDRTVGGGDVARIRGWVGELTRDPPALIAGVADTLAELAGRHDLLLLTKGDVAEQQRKIDRSGLGGWFRRTLIVREKDPAAYRRLVSEHGLDPSRSWMIGNSPKSDVNPARAAGLGAVLIPNANTWSLEHEELRYHDDRTITLARFKDLLDLF